jgi:hypothetical protein
MSPGPILLPSQDRRPRDPPTANYPARSDFCDLTRSPTLHERMPVILEREQFPVWLDHNVRDVKSILRAANANGLSMFPVSRDVNKVANDGPALIERTAEPTDEAPRQRSLF